MRGNGMEKAKLVHTAKIVGEKWFNPKGWSPLPTEAKGQNMRCKDRGQEMSDVEGRETKLSWNDKLDGIGQTQSTAQTTTSCSFKHSNLH